MGRKLTTSQPAVINTELPQLTEAFSIDADNALEQWYYDNTSEYMPDRAVVPLTLTPKISVYDPETGITNSPNIYTTAWYALEYVGTAWKETQITNVTDTSSSDYIISGESLIVKKNVGYTYGVTIRCVVQYIDPRDSGVVHTTSGSVELSTNRDATVIFPSIDILKAGATPFNPLLMDDSLFSFKAQATLGGEDVTGKTYFFWYVVEDGETSEKPAEESLAYVSGQNTNTLVLDAMYTEHITIILRAKESASSPSFYPDKKYRVLGWRIPNVESTVLSENGSAVRKSSGIMSFATIINTNKSVLSEEKKLEHLAFEWRMRRANVSSETSLGWAPSVSVDRASLKGSANMVIYPNVYLYGAYRKVSYEDGDVTFDGKIVVSRTTN